MFQKFALAAAAALTLGAGVASVPSQASAASVYISSGGGHHAGHSNRHVYRKHCRVKKVVWHNKWGKRVVRMVRTCR